MSYVKIPTRTTYNLNSASDVNQLMENIETLAGEETPSSDIKTLLSLMQNLAKPSYDNLTVKPNTSSPNYQVDIAFDGLYIEGQYLTSKSYTADITVSGVNGLDTDSEAVSTWYYIWIISNDTTTSTGAILSTSATSPTLPAGYTLARLVSAVYNMSDGHFRSTYQINTSIRYAAECTGVSAGYATTPTDIIISSFIPPISHSVLVRLHNNTSEYIYGYVYGYINGVSVRQISLGTYINTLGGVIEHVITDNQKLQYNNTNTGLSHTGVYLIGFEVNI